MSRRILILVILIWSCNTPKETIALSKPKVESYSFKHTLENYLESQEIQYRRIDTLTEQIFNSEFTLCNFYQYSVEYYLSKNKLPLKSIDELVLLNNMSIKNEHYLYHKLLRNHDYQNTKNKENWYNCILLFPKKDCMDGDFYHRMNRLPWILRDTSNVENSTDLLDHIGDILVKERCRTNTHFLKEEVEWRKELFESAKLQIPIIKGEYSEYIEDVYWLMLHLPDSLTTDFAYNYFMNNEITALTFYNYEDNTLIDLDNIVDLLGDRMFNQHLKYIDYKGPKIYLSLEQTESLLTKAQSIPDQENCDWCNWFIRDLKWAKEMYLK